jgi:mono/diheme cytochrome c family protein
MKKLTITAIVATLCVAGMNTALAADGADVYGKRCASCHGKDGKGQTTMGKKFNAKDYTTAAAWEGLTDDKAFKSVKEGMKVDGKEVMKPFDGKITDDEIKAAIAHLKTFKP